MLFLLQIPLPNVAARRHTQFPRWRCHIWVVSTILLLRGGLNAETFEKMEDSLLLQIEDELLGEDWLDSFATEIIDAKYTVLDIDGVVNDMSHLTDVQKDDMKY